MVYTSVGRSTARESALEAVSLVIDRTKSLDEVVKVGAYDYLNPAITEANFPTAVGPTQLQVLLVHLNRRAWMAEVTEELASHALQPGSMTELVALGAYRPELQRQFPIVALGSDWFDAEDNYCVGYLEGDSTFRGLGLRHLNTEFGAGCRFLALAN
jgi:hypothetical protein